MKSVLTRRERGGGCLFAGKERKNGAERRRKRLDNSDKSLYCVWIESAELPGDAVQRAPANG